MAVVTHHVSDGPLTCRKWNAREWLSKESVWNTLTAAAVTDHLFLSWEWLTTWWRHFGEPLGGVLDILGFYRGDELVGLAPLYHRRVMRSGFLPVRSVQFVGLAWREPRPLISEYLDVIGSARDLDRIRTGCMQYLLDEADWTEFVVGLTAAGAQWHKLYEQSTPRPQHYVRQLDRAVTYQANLGCGFAAYLRDLGQSTRRSVWNLRRRLEALGEVSVSQVQFEGLESGFQELNRLHEMRWNKPAFVGKRLAFHIDLARRLAAQGELFFSRLSVGKEVVSILYDVRKGSRQYNIKMAFDATLSSQISLGLLHFGYAMEAAAQEGVQRYDFLAGPGRATDFKRALCQENHELSSVQMLRGPVLPLIYRWRDRIRPSGSNISR